MFNFHLGKKKIKIIYSFKNRLGNFSKIHFSLYLYTSCSNNSTFCIMIRTIFTFLRTKWPATPIWKQNLFFFKYFFFRQMVCNWKINWFIPGASIFRIGNFFMATQTNRFCKLTRSYDHRQFIKNKLSWL